MSFVKSFLAVFLLVGLTGVSILPPGPDEESVFPGIACDTYFQAHRVLSAVKTGSEEGVRVYELFNSFEGPQGPLCRGGYYRIIGIFGRSVVRDVLFNGSYYDAYILEVKSDLEDPEPYFLLIFSRLPGQAV